MRRALVIGAVLLLCGGCAVTLRDAGSIELFFGTSLGVRTTTSSTQSESEARLASQPLEDWIKSQQQDEVQPEAKVAPEDVTSNGPVEVSTNGA